MEQSPDLCGSQYWDCFTGNTPNISHIFVFSPMTYNFKHKNHITIRFYTCTDSSAVGTCAKFYGDRASNIQIMVYTILYLEVKNG